MSSKATTKQSSPKAPAKKPAAATAAAAKPRQKVEPAKVRVKDSPWVIGDNQVSTLSGYYTRGLNAR